MRLIDVEKMIIKIPAELPARQRLRILNIIRENIEQTPTVDAEPVRHGHWTVDKWSDDAIMRTEFNCSACLVQFVAPGDVDVSIFEYCPHCGRKMDEEADDE